MDGAKKAGNMSGLESVFCLKKIKPLNLQLRRSNLVRDNTLGLQCCLFKPYKILNLSKKTLQLEL